MTPPPVIHHLSSNTFGHFVRVDKNKDGIVWVYKGATSEYHLTEERMKYLMDVKLLSIEKPSASSLTSE